METYSRNKTICVATSNKMVIAVVEEIATRMSKKIFYAEPNSPNILAVPCICVVADKVFVGEDYLQMFSDLISDQVDKDSIIFLILIDDMELELVKQKTMEAILKTKGIYMYPHPKKYRIIIHKYQSYGWSHSPADIDGMDDLKEILRLEKARNICLGYFDIIDDTPNIHEHSIKPEGFSEEHFKWLTAKVKGVSRYIEFN